MAGIAPETRADDDALVVAVRRGDDRAFEELYARYQRRVAAYAFGMVKDHGRAEDLTQEIFLSALRRMRATERPIAFKPWIYEIARNACIDQFRRSRRAEEVSFDAEEAAGTLDAARLPGGSSADHAVDAKQQLDDLCGAFGGLSDAHHEILVMRELEGLSYREIGDRLGLSRPSVESTLFRARKRLTEEYEELVSGERCRRVSEMLVADAQSRGARDERRLARHVAHCQPCRRQAYAAGVETATLTKLPRRTGVARVAALLPLPAFLRLRGNQVSTWSTSVAAVAEPAAGWTKAVVAAAVLVAGGAGVAGHSDAPAPFVGAERAPAATSQAPAADARGDKARRTGARAPAIPPASSEARRAVTRGTDASGAAAGPAAGGLGPAEPGVLGVPEDAPELPSARHLPADGGDETGLPAHLRNDGAGAPARPSADPDLGVNPPSSTDEAARQLEVEATKVDGNAGAAVGSASEALNALG